MTLVLICAYISIFCAGVAFGSWWESGRRYNLVHRIITDKNSTLEQIKDALKFNYR